MGKFVLTDISREMPIDKVTPMGGTPWEFDTADEARLAAVKYGYHEVMYGWFLLDDERDRRYKPSVLKLTDLGGLENGESKKERVEVKKTEGEIEH